MNSRRSVSRCFALGLAVAAICSLASIEASAENACRNLETLSFEQATDNPAVVIRAQHVIEAEESLKFQFMFGRRSVVQGAYVTELPPHCRVEGYVAPAVRFLILLPEAHNWNGAVNAQMTLDWYLGVKELMGDSTSDFLQLYLLPGSKHGGSPGDGPNINNSLEALEKWVEEGVKPTGLLLKREVDGETVRTRPAYPYPAVARYKGEGSIDDAANFEAVLP